MPKKSRPIDVIAAGHICLDVIPGLNDRQRSFNDLIVPGGLTQVGPATMSLGGSVANTGIALHKLGARTQLVGKVGNDLLGKAILESLHQFAGLDLTHMVVAVGDSTSYTIVLSVPDVDRAFLHCPGANDTMVAADLGRLSLEQTRILHFGYPPLMRGIYADEGHGLAELFAQAQAAGALVSLDMAMPQSGSANWRQWLQRVLPHVDVFLPSLDEVSILLDPHREQPDQSFLPHRQESLDYAALLADLSNELHGFGVPIVALKLGAQGLYLSTRATVANLKYRTAWSDTVWDCWTHRQLVAPCFAANVVGTTGAGDVTVAGFLWALLRGFSPEKALRAATAVGAFSVESADATSNIPCWSNVEQRLATWETKTLEVELTGWDFHASQGLYVGPQDSYFT